MALKRLTKPNSTFSIGCSRASYILALIAATASFYLVLFGGLDSISGKSWIRSGEDISFPSDPRFLCSSKSARSHSRTRQIHTNLRALLHPLLREQNPPLNFWLLTAAVCQRRSDKRMAESSQPVSELDKRPLSNLSSCPDRTRHLYS